MSEDASPSLRRATLDLLGAQVVRNLAPILLLFLLARFTDQATVGRFSLTLAVATPVFVFAQLGLRTVSLTLKPDAAFADYVKTQLGSVALALVVVAVVGAIATPALLLGMVFVGLLKTADVFADFLSGPLQRRHRSRVVLIASVIYAVSASIAAAVMLSTTKSLEATILVVAVVSLIAMYVFLYRPALAITRNEVVGIPARGEVRRILAAGVPLGVTTAILSLISTFPQYVITANGGAAETARFAVLLYVYALADLVTATIAQAWIPSAQQSLLEREGPRALGLALRSAAKWTIVYIPVVVVGLFLTATLFPLIFGPRYTLSVGEAIPLGLAIVALPIAHFTAVAVAIENYYSHSVILAGVSAVVAIVGCLILIPLLGIAGAFASLLAAVLVRALIAAGILFWFRKKPKEGPASWPSSA